MATPTLAPPASLLDQKLKKSNPGKLGVAVFVAMLIGGVIYIARALSHDLSIVHNASVFPFILLGIALMIALGFEFVNGFHDTANAVATVIYTHSLEPHIAVVYSGIMNFIGVLFSSGTVAYSVISLLPVELILKVSTRFRICDGVCAAGRGDHLEPGDVVARAAGFELAHDDRVDHRRRNREPADAGKPGNRRGGLGAGDEGIYGVGCSRRSSGLSEQRCCSFCSSWWRATRGFTRPRRARRLRRSTSGCC